MAILVLYCVTVYILVFGVECVTFKNVVFMGVTDRQVRVHVYCCIVWLYIYIYWYFVCDCFTYSSVVFVEGTDRKYNVAHLQCCIV